MVGLPRGWRLTEVVAPSEAFDTSLGVDDPLLARVKRVAFAAKLDSYGGFGPTGFEYIAAGAGYR